MLYLSLILRELSGTILILNTYNFFATVKDANKGVYNTPSKNKLFDFSSD